MFVAVGDCIEGMRGIADASVDAIVTDPPYELGFMGKSWDASGIAYQVELWRECLRVLKPGGHMLAFSGSRTYHRMVVAIEDAGFEIRDQIMWVYGSGFPKSLDVSKAIDKAAGVEREVVGVRPAGSGPLKTGHVNVGGGGGMSVGTERSPETYVTIAATAAARQWEGWGTALKPAHEPICVARKPLIKPATNVLHMVESELRKRGVIGEILWKSENVKNAGSQKSVACSDSTPRMAQSEMSVKTAGDNGTGRLEQKTLKNSGQPIKSGVIQTGIEYEASQESVDSCSEMKYSTLMGENAHVAEKPIEIFSHSTILMEGAQSTENQYTEKSTQKSVASATQPDTECFAGIATGLTGSMEVVHIIRGRDGHFIWPLGLPKSVPGVPLTVAANVQMYGTGAINIDGCRIPTADDLNGGAYSANRGEVNTTSYGLGGTGEEFIAPVGRWPANLIHDGSDEVLAAFPDAKGFVGEQHGDRTSVNTYGDWGPRPDTPPRTELDKSAARFFYCAKAGKRDRDEGLEGFTKQAGGMVSENSGQHITRREPDYAPAPRANIHPTVKPTDLMRYLCRLVTPPGGLILDPFSGSGSTGKAAILEGFAFMGFEQSAEYAEIANARIMHALLTNTGNT
jgi:DNA modification methylase